MNGCTNPNAVNYNPAADVDDRSCIFLVSHNDECKKFVDAPLDDLDDRSFTMSYSVKGQSWVFFHDYIPDMYIHTRDKLLSAKDNRFYEHNTGNPGAYYSDIKPFFIDVIFKQGEDMVLESVQWITEFINSQTDQQFSTLTHLSIWNSHQHTNRLSLTQIFQDLAYDNIRKTKGSWSLNDFRDVLSNEGDDFIYNIFRDYAVIPEQIAENLPWYEQKVMQDKWFCIRFEFDNNTGNKVIIHDVGINALNSDR